MVANQAGFSYADQLGAPIQAAPFFINYAYTLLTEADQVDSDRSTKKGQLFLRLRQCNRHDVNEPTGDPPIRPANVTAPSSSCRGDPRHTWASSTRAADFSDRAPSTPRPSAKATFTAMSWRMPGPSSEVQCAPYSED